MESLKLTVRGLLIGIMVSSLIVHPSALLVKSRSATEFSSSSSIW